MKIFNLLVLFLISIPFSVYGQQKVPVIFDTDMESDVDDAGALAVLHTLADQGEAEILATMVSSLNPWSAPAVDVINTYYGRPDIPIGNVKTKGVYRNSVYARAIAEKFPQDLGLGENAPDATDLYRKILADQDDNSVVIVTVGYTTNMANLLTSTPDEYSDLNGMELVREKVKHYICMGGRYPVQLDPGKWGNFKPDAEATHYVVNQWPTDIIFTGGGEFAESVPSGKKLMETENAENPVYDAYDIFFECSWGERPSHHSADIIAVYVAVRGHEQFFTREYKGYNHIFEDGTMVWRQQPEDPRHSYVSALKEGVEPPEVIREFDALLAAGAREK